MAIPNIFISHRWAYSVDYTSLTSKLKSYCLKYYDYSVPEIDPFDLKKKKEIKEALKEQIRQCNYFIVFANIRKFFAVEKYTITMRMQDSICKPEVAIVLSRENFHERVNSFDFAKCRSKLFYKYLNLFSYLKFVLFF